MVFSDEEDENENGFCVDHLLPGDWIVSKCEFFVRNKLSINYYVGQILFPVDNIPNMEEDELGVQFYRSDISSNEHVYVQLQNKEAAKKNTIVEKIDKPEILTGGRIKLLSLPKIGKLV